MATKTLERTDFLASCMVTAIEGGINYWADIEDWEWKEDDQHNFTQASARIRDIDQNGQWINVGLDDIARGIGKLLDKDFKINDEIQSWVRDGSATNDASNIDSWTADAIVQAAIFGEVVYG